MNKVECSTINIDCCHNDPVDIRCGGPEYLGFDFYVKRHEEQEMIRFIIDAMNELHIPLMSISIGELITVAEKDVWTKERILESLTREADEIISESERSYNSDLKFGM